MSNILNYNMGETIATGFVRPKVTALFFDKVWIPKSLVDISFEFFIPDEVLICESEELMLNSRWSAASHYRRSRRKNRSMKSGEAYFFAGASNNIFFDEINIPQYKYSKNRNRTIMESSKSFSKKYKLHIFPVYHNLTEFERDVEDFNESLLHKPKVFLNKDALSICVQDFPSIIEEELSWEQVLDCRKDKKTIQQFRKFTTWATGTFSNASPEQIRETINHELDSYETALREHGIKTAVGSFSTIVSGASSIASLLSNPNMFMLPMLSIASISLSFTVNTHFSNQTNKNRPIAYLYNIEQGM